MFFPEGHFFSRFFNILSAEVYKTGDFNTFLEPTTLHRAAEHNGHRSRKRALRQVYMGVTEGTGVIEGSREIHDGEETPDTLLRLSEDLSSWLQLFLDQSTTSESGPQRLHFDAYLLHHASVITNLFSQKLDITDVLGKNLNRAELLRLMYGFQAQRASFASIDAHAAPDTLQQLSETATTFSIGIVNLDNQRDIVQYFGPRLNLKPTEAHRLVTLTDLQTVTAQEARIPRWTDEIYDWLAIHYPHFLLSVLNTVSKYQRHERTQQRFDRVINAIEWATLQGFVVVISASNFAELIGSTTEYVDQTLGVLSSKINPAVLGKGENAVLVFPYKTIIPSPDTTPL